MTTTDLPRGDTRTDRRGPAVRLTDLFDTPPEPIGPSGFDHDSGVGVASGTVRGVEVLAFCTDASVMGGALGARGAARIVWTIDEAVRRGCPVVGIWHSGGARLADGVESMDGVGRMFRAMTAASGRVPQLSLVLGPSAGAAVYGPALTDVVVMSGSGRMFVTGPDVVRSVTAEDVDMEALGGADAHGRRSGVAHVTVDDDRAAYERTRSLVGLLARPGTPDPARCGSRPALDTALPAARRRAYDVRPLVRELLDPGEIVELQSGWAPNMVVALGRLGGATVGVLANNPLRKGGCLDSLSAEKAARFVRMCDALGIPLVVVVDVPGYLPGVDEEWGGVIRRGAKLLHAFAEATVPRATLITRKAYGGAYIAMNSRSLGADAVLAWPTAEVAVMGAAAAVRVLHRKELAAATDDGRAEVEARLVREHERVSGGVERALALGVVDAVVSPGDSPRSLAAVLAAAPGGRGRHGNIPL